MERMPIFSTRNIEGSSSTNKIRVLAGGVPPEDETSGARQRVVGRTPVTAAIGRSRNDMLSCLG